jgi:splicing factor 3A subunit 1
VEKTVGYMIRNGAAFVDRIRDREKSDLKFSFLYENDTYIMLTTGGG